MTGLKQRLLILVVFILLCMTGCGTGDNGQERNDASCKSYEVFYRTVQLDKDRNIMNFTRMGQSLYAICYDSIRESGKCEILYLEDKKCWQGTGYLQFDRLSAEVGYEDIPVVLFSDEKEILYLLTSVKTENSWNYFLYEYDRKCNMSGCTDVTESIKEFWNGEMDPGTVKAAVDSSGRIYLGNFINQNKLLILNTDKNMKCVVEFEKITVLDMTCTGGEVYIAGQKGKKDILYKIDADIGRYGQIAELPESMGTVLLCAGQEGDMLYGSYDRIYTCMLENQSAECIYAWTDLGFTGKHINVFYVDGEGRIFICVKKDQDSETFSLIILEDQSVWDSETGNSEPELSAAEKKEIILAGDPMDVQLRQIVGQFNTSNEKYKVVIKSYDQERLLTEMLSGNGPDLVSNNAIDFRECVEKGMIEDLTFYLENSQALTEEMLFEKVMEVYTIDNVLTCIPPAFYIDSLYGRASELGRQPGWTMQEFLTYVEGHRGCSVLEGSTFGDSQNMIIILNWWSQQDKWVDWESGTAFFDSEDFRTLVEFAAGYKSFYDDTVFQEESEERWQEGKIALLNNAVVNFENYMDIKDLMSGDMISIGYPNENGIPVYGIGGYRGYGISSSADKEGAWAFIEYQVLNQKGSLKADGGIPTLKSAYQDMIDEAVSYRNGIEENDLSNGERNANGEFFVTQEDIEIFEYMIENAAFGGGRYSAVESILLEEMESCFSGDRTVDETVGIIQNRVQLYLDERK